MAELTNDGAPAARGADAEPPPAVESLISVARDIATLAGQLTLRWFGQRDLGVTWKPDGTEVTEADRAAERRAREEITQRFPHDAIFGEEEGGVIRRDGRTWIIDPIDGTRGFVRGVPLYATLLALVDEHGPLVGVIDLPAMGLTLAAGRDAGCWLGDHRCSVSERTALDGAVVNTSSFETFDSEQFEALRAAGAMMRTWGDAYGYFLVATGHAEAMIDPICEVWDLAPMPVIIAEAGGIFTDMSGRPDYRNRNGIATNGALHSAVIDAMHPTSGAADG
ncbi:inositol monophosphatase family protein [Candidatus Poriferisodalis sp.]|uniref:inositol monophosphatase family protein n=1 Tax=Candidatus Poriferisodalis sp. TaxID=3101277 RepID=UPI003D0E274A